MGSARSATPRRWTETNLSLSAKSPFGGSIPKLGHSLGHSGLELLLCPLPFACIQEELEIGVGNSNRESLPLLHQLNHDGDDSLERAIPLQDRPTGSGLLEALRRNGYEPCRAESSHGRLKLSFGGHRPIQVVEAEHDIGQAIPPHRTYRHKDPCVRVGEDDIIHGVVRPLAPR